MARTLSRFESVFLAGLVLEFASAVWLWFRPGDAPAWLGVGFGSGLVAACVLLGNSRPPVAREVCGGREGVAVGVGGGATGVGGG